MANYYFLLFFMKQPQAAKEGCRKLHYTVVYIGWVNSVIPGSASNSIV